MKSNLFRTVLYEKTFEINDSVRGAIDKWMQFSGDIVETQNILIRFKCNKKGKIKVGKKFTYIERRTGTNVNDVLIKGRVCEKNGKTVLKIWAVRAKVMLPLLIILPIAALLLWGTYLSNLGYHPVGIFIFLFFYIICLGFILSVILGKRKLNKLYLQQMEEEIAKRVKAINCWNK